MSFKIKMGDINVSRMRETGFVQFVTRDELEEKSSLYCDVIDFLESKVSLTPEDKGHLQKLLDGITKWCCHPDRKV